MSSSTSVIQRHTLSSLISSAVDFTKQNMCWRKIYCLWSCKTFHWCIYFNINLKLTQNTAVIDFSRVRMTHIWSRGCIIFPNGWAVNGGVAAVEWARRGEAVEGTVVMAKKNSHSWPAFCCVCSFYRLHEISQLMRNFKLEILGKRNVTRRVLAGDARWWVDRLTVTVNSASKVVAAGLALLNAT